MRYRSQTPCAEWRDKLAQALRPDELSVAEQAAFQEHIARCAACATTFADYQDLAARVRALPRSTHELHPFPDFFVVENSRKRGYRLNESNGTETNRAQEIAGSDLPISVAQPRKQTWQRRAAALAAILLVGALIGTFALVSTRSARTSATVVFKLAHDWKQTALYRGTGSQTIALKNMQLPQLWGYAYACQGSGNLAIKLTGEKSVIETGTDRCNTSSVTAPIELYLSLSTTSLQKIQVTAAASTVWYLQLDEEGTQSVVPLNTSVWVSNIGIGGPGASGIVVADVPPFYTHAGQQFTPKVWAILSVCIGAGHGVFQISTNEDINNFVGASTIDFPVCNGEPVVSIIHHPPASQVHEVQAMPSEKMLWQALLLGCASADVAACK